MDDDPLARLLTAATDIAANAPKTQGTNVGSTLVWWPRVRELQAALDELGIEWR